MDQEEDLIDMCVLSQAGHIDLLLKRILDLENQAKSKEAVSNSTPFDTTTTADDAELMKELEDQAQQLHILSDENERLTQQLEFEKNKCDQLKAKYDDDMSAYINMQSQSVKQIESLGKENTSLRDEIIKLRIDVKRLQEEITSKKQEIDNGNSAAVASLQQENKQLEDSVRQTNEKMQFLQDQLNSKSVNSNLQSIIPISGGPIQMGSYDGNLDVSTMNEEALRQQLISDHSQLNSTSSYLHEIEGMIDNFLHQFTCDYVSDASTPTHDKLQLLVDVLQSSPEGEAGDQYEEWRNMAENNYQSAQEWKDEALRAQKEGNDIKGEAESLEECLNVADNYLEKLVGDAGNEETDRLSRLQYRFELTCQRSQKLMNEYRQQQKALRLLQRDAGSVLSRDPLSSASAANALSSSINSIMSVAHSLAVHMHVLPAGGKPSWNELEAALQRIDTIAREEMPLLARRLKELKGRADVERLERERMEGKVHELEMRVCRLQYGK